MPFDQPGRPPSACLTVSRSRPRAPPQPRPKLRPPCPETPPPSSLTPGARERHPVQHPKRGKSVRAETWSKESVRVAPGQSSSSISAVHLCGGRDTRPALRSDSCALYSRRRVIVSSLREVLEGWGCKLHTKCVLLHYARKIYTEKKYTKKLTEVKQWKFCSLSASSVWL